MKLYKSDGGYFITKPSVNTRYQSAWTIEEALDNEWYNRVTNKPHIGFKDEIVVLLKQSDSREVLRNYRL